MAEAGGSEEAAAWAPDSWRTKPAKQLVTYPDEEALNSTLTELNRLPPLVSVKEIESLREQLAEVAEGKRFALQGGDCAERFEDCQEDAIRKKLRIMLQMSLVLTWGARIPTVRVARMAGQFAKPRSKEKEMVGEELVHTFRGDNINGFDVKDRTPDPARMLKGYFHSAATLLAAKSLIADGFADIHDAAHWNLGFVADSSKREQYEKLVEDVADAISFAHTCGVTQAQSLGVVDLYVCHEGMALPYEQSLTRQAPDGKWYNRGAQFIWIGDRTRQLDGAHVEYFRGLANPIGIKVGPTMAPEDLVPLIRALWPDPEGTPGKITLITRYGAGKVSSLLPKHIAAVQESGLKPVWICDPCHGNTTTSESGYKTRDFDMVLAEVNKAFEVHDRMGSVFGGVHIELTGENVTECVGGPENLMDSDLPMRYTTYCDPRLNYAQSMEMAFLLAKLIARSKKKRCTGAAPPAAAASSPLRPAKRARQEAGAAAGL
jgi:3-deoxy-7-phosphoheptulonate synthase